MRILVEVIDSSGVEAAGSALDAMHRVALLQQKLCQVASVLAGNACDQRAASRLSHLRVCIRMQRLTGAASRA